MPRRLLPGALTDAAGQAARTGGEASPDRTNRQPVPPTSENSATPQPVAPPAQPGEEATHPVVEDTIPAPDDLTSESTFGLSRIAWSLTTVACLIAMVVLGLRGDIGYAGVTLAVALAAAINLF